MVVVASQHMSSAGTVQMVVPVSSSRGTTQMSMIVPCSGSALPPAIVLCSDGGDTVHQPFAFAFRLAISLVELPRDVCLGLHPNFAVHFQLVLIHDDK